MVGLGWLGTSWDPGSGCQFGSGSFECEVRPRSSPEAASSHLGRLQPAAVWGPLLLKGSGQFQTKKFNKPNKRSSVLAQRSFLGRQGAQKSMEPSFPGPGSLLRFSRRRPGSWRQTVYLSHERRSTFMVIVFYRLIDFYILSKSGSYTTWFII